VSERDAARVDAHQARLALVTTLVTLYSQLDYDYATRDLLQQKERDDDELDAILRTRAGRGLDNGYDAENARIRQAALRAQLQQAGDAITQAQLQIGVLTGRGPERGLALSRPSMADSGLSALPANLPLELLGRRPDIVAARLRVQAATGRIAAAHAQFYPNINLFAAAGLSTLSVGTLLSGSSVLFAAGPAVSLPIFERPSLRAQLRGDEANADAMIALYNKTLDEALGEVAKSITTLHGVDALIAQQEQIVAARTRILRIAAERHRRGLMRQADLLAACTALLDEELQLVSLRARRRDAHITLIRALGGGFDLKENDVHA
jgi:NodT family efflux transporter outer membrane factor (OMF) lipoprotein